MIKSLLVCLSDLFVFYIHVHNLSAKKSTINFPSKMIFLLQAFLVSDPFHTDGELPHGSGFRLTDPFR